MGIFKKIKRNRVCVIGLDGVPHSMLRNLAERDIMPYFRILIESGHLHPMKASLPEISAVSWTDFMTGTNSGSHGIFGFTDLKLHSYDLRFPNFHDVRAETLWDKLGKRKLRSIIINQPSTYPARRINGVLISGFVAIELSKAVYPISYKTALEKIGYEIDIDTFRSRENHEILWRDLDKTLAGRSQAFHLLWNEDWDYFEFVITGTDRLQHFLWNAYTDSEHPSHQKFLDYYRRVDDVVRTIAQAFEKSTGGLEGFHLLSDHGFTGIEQEVHLNAWLQKKGFLRFDGGEPQNLGDISADAQAFALDPSRIYLHTKDRYPKGGVLHSERDEILSEIGTELLKLEFEGKKVIRRVFDAKEIYNGPLTHMGPDLVVLGHSGFDLKGSVKKKEIFGRTVLQGMHTWDDAFFWSLGDHGPDLSISDLQTILLERF